VVPTPTPSPIATPTPVVTPTPVPSTPVYTGTPTGNDASFTTAQTIAAPTTQQGCYQVAFVITDNPGVAYTGYPAGWTPVLAVPPAGGTGPEESEIIIHPNGPSEPASNTWTTAGTKTTVFELNISGVCNTSGFDGGIAAYSGNKASSMTIAAPPISSSESGANDLTLAFSNMPWDAIVMMSGPNNLVLNGFYTSVPSLGGYWYTGIPQSLNVTVDNTNLEYDGDGVTFQAAFAPPATGGN
jgi:hypothetical protein